MASPLINISLCQKFLNLTLNQTVLPVRNRSYLPTPKLRYPKWFVKKERVLHEDYITADNKDFIQEVIRERLAVAKTMVSLPSPLLDEPLPHGEWNVRTRRVGLIARKIGDYPLWSTKGRKIHTSLLQVVDNHVIKYIPPEAWDPPRKPLRPIQHKLGCLLVGAETIDPSLVTKEYYGLFKNSGVPAKRHICRFMVSPEAAITPGTPLVASHFRVGDRIDVRGKTIDYGFQGVVKRWGFKGLPASHGVTKSHRRPGNIGGGGEKGRVWPGTKMPGHMGNRWRVLRGVRILRINTKHNVIWVEGVGIAGPTNGLCYLFDTVLPDRKLQSAPPFPTYTPAENEDEDIFHESVRPFDMPTLTFSE